MVESGLSTNVALIYFTVSDKKSFTDGRRSMQGGAPALALLTQSSRATCKNTKRPHGPWRSTSTIEQCWST